MQKLDKIQEVKVAEQSVEVDPRCTYYYSI